MRAWRQAGTSTLPSSSRGGLSSGCSSSQKPRARACSSLTHSVRVTSSSEWASCSALSTSSSKRRQARGCILSSPSARPSRRVSIGNSMQRRRLVAAPAELDRAHRRAPRRRRQDAPAGVGEEDRVDELGLAARELGDEGDDELLVAEPLAQRVEVLGGRAVRQVVLGEELGERVEPLAQRGAPAAEGVETVGEGRSHRNRGWPSWQSHEAS